MIRMSTTRGVKCLKWAMRNEYCSECCSHGSVIFVVVFGVTKRGDVGSRMIPITANPQHGFCQAGAAITQYRARAGGRLGITQREITQYRAMPGYGPRFTRHATGKHGPWSWCNYHRCRKYAHRWFNPKRGVDTSNITVPVCADCRDWINRFPDAATYLQLLDRPGHVSEPGWWYHANGSTRSNGGRRKLEWHQYPPPVPDGSDDEVIDRVLQILQRND